MQTIRNAVTPVVVLILSIVVIYDHVGRRLAPAPRPAPAPVVDGAAWGKTYGPVLVSTYADAWLVAAQTLDDGKSVAEAQQALQDSWKAARTQAFAARVGPQLATVLPEGTEPADAAQRAQVAEVWRAFAKGLRGGK